MEHLGCLVYYYYYVQSWPSQSTASYAQGELQSLVHFRISRKNKLETQYQNKRKKGLIGILTFLVEPACLIIGSQLILQSEFRLKYRGRLYLPIRILK